MEAARTVPRRTKSARQLERVAEKFKIDRVFVANLLADFGRVKGRDLGAGIRLVLVRASNLGSLWGVSGHDALQFLLEVLESEEAVVADHIAENIVILYAPMRVHFFRRLRRDVVDETRKIH